MAQFTPAYELTMINEGGYANDPHDKGGETWKGISRKNWGDWPGWEIIDSIKEKQHLHLNQALYNDESLNELVVSFYKHNFWNPLELDLLNCQQTANQLFDVAVNMGVSVAAKFLQQAINAFHHPSLLIDGRVGPLTIGAANQLVHQNLYDQVNRLRAARYEQIVAATPSDARFEHAWMSRIRPFGPDNDQDMA